MKRKLVKQGAATLMISLPTKWLKDHGLGKGQDIDLTLMDDHLIISSEESGSKREAEITLWDLNESSIRTLITNTYRKGFERVIINFEDEKQFELMEEVIRTYLIGFDVVKKEKNKCIVENITEPSSDQFGNILSKVFLNIETLVEITKNRFEGKKPEENYIDIEKRIMQYDNFCRRVISKGSFIREKKEFFWTFLHLIDHGQRELYHLNKALNNIKLSKPVKDLLNSVEKMFKLSVKVFKEKDTKALSEMHILNKEALYKKGYSILEKTTGKENIIVYHLMSSLRKFFQTNSPLSGMIL